jgi:hypothetical protein
MLGAVSLLFAGLSGATLGLTHVEAAAPHRLPWRAASPVEAVGFRPLVASHRVAGVPGRHAAKPQRHPWFRGVVPFIEREARRERLEEPRQEPPAFRMRPAARDPQRPRSFSSTWLTRCEARFATFDAQSGTYLGEDGTRHRCR